MARFYKNTPFNKITNNFFGFYFISIGVVILDLFILKLIEESVIFTNSINQILVIFSILFPTPLIVGFLIKREVWGLQITDTGLLNRKNEILIRKSEITTITCVNKYEPQGRRLVRCLLYTFYMNNNDQYCLKIYDKNQSEKDLESLRNFSYPIPQQIPELN